MPRFMLMLFAALCGGLGASTPLPTPCPVNINACSWGLGQPGDILVTMPFTGYIAGLNSSTGTWYIFGQASTGSIDGIVVDPFNPSRVHVMQEASGSIQSFDGNGTSLGLFGTSASTKSKMGAFNPIDGSLWVPMQDPSKIFRFPAGGGAAVEIVTSGAPLYYPSGMAFDHSGNLYISNAGLDQILKIDASQLSQPNPAVTVLSSGVANALGLVFDGDHTLYSAGWFPSSPMNSSQIWRTDTVTGAASLVTMTFAPIAENGGGPLYQCDGITMDLKGHLWVMLFMNPGSGSGLLELDTNGTCIAWYEKPTSIGGIPMSGSGLDAVAVMGFSFPRPGSCPANIDLNCPSPTPTPTATLSVAITPTLAATQTAEPGGGKTLVIPNNRMLGKSQQSFNLRCPVSGMTRLKLLDSSGRVLIELFAESMEAGQHKVLTWDGKDSSGKYLPSGVYIAVVVAADGHIYKQNFMIIR